VRQTFVTVLTEIAERDPRVLLLTADLGYTVLERFADRFPARFFNVGVAEQNMVGVASGLAASGYVPFVYSIAPFAVLRPYEAIRNGPVHHQLPVRIVGVGGGMEYGHNGPSHFALEDVAVTRTQPGLRVVVPADCPQARAALSATWALPGPTYYRLGKDEKSLVPDLDGRFDLDRVAQIGDGSEIALVAMGPMAIEARAALERIRAAGHGGALLVVSMLSPAPVEDLAERLARYAHVMTVEAHYVNGGLGSLVAEIIAERGLRCRLTRCGVREQPGGALGHEHDLLRRFALSSEALAATALGALQEA
jgi:transketolase